jgi:hypothetical protein
MQKKRSSEKTTASVIGRRQFSKISSVEGIRLSSAMKRAFAEFDRTGLSAERRRKSIINRFKQRAGQKASV